MKERENEGRWWRWRQLACWRWLEKEIGNGTVVVNDWDGGGLVVELGGGIRV